MTSVMNTTLKLRQNILNCIFIKTSFFSLHHLFFLTTFPKFKIRITCSVCVRERLYKCKRVIPLRLCPLKMEPVLGFWLHPLSEHEGGQGCSSQCEDGEEVLAVRAGVCARCGVCVRRAWSITQRGVAAADAHGAQTTRRAEPLIPCWGDQTRGVGCTRLPIKHTWGGDDFYSLHLI